MDWAEKLKGFRLCEEFCFIFPLYIVCVCSDIPKGDIFAQAQLQAAVHRAKACRCIPRYVVNEFNKMYY